MLQEPIKFQIDWHLIEKVVWIVGTAFVTAILTIARPWLGKQIIKLLREDRGAYKEFGMEMWADTFRKIDNSADKVEDALRQVGAMRERLEKVESATDEQGEALIELQEMPARVTRMGEALEAFMHEHSEMKVLMARIDERQKARATRSLEALK